MIEQIVGKVKDRDLRGIEEEGADAGQTRVQKAEWGERVVR